MGAGIPLRWNGWLSHLFSLPNRAPPYFVIRSIMKCQCIFTILTWLFCLLNIRHNHIVELLRPVGVEVRHLEPVSLIFNADVIQLNENLG